MLSKEITYNGKVYQSHQQLGNAIGKHPSVISRTLKAGIPLEEKFEPKVKDHLGNVFKSERKMCLFYGVSYDVFKRRLSKGISLEDALSDKMYKDHLGNRYRTLSEMLKAYNIEFRTYYVRKSQNLPLKEILTGEHVKLGRQSWSKKSVEARQVTDHLGNVFPSQKAMAEHYNILPSYFSLLKTKRKMSIEEILTLKEKENLDNRRKKSVDHLGQEFPSVTEMCKHWNIDVMRFRSRINSNWDLEKALTSPVMKKRKTRKGKNKNKKMNS